MTSGRNSIGVEIDKSFQSAICPMARQIVDFSNDYLRDRLKRHFEFVEDRIQKSGTVEIYEQVLWVPRSDEPGTVHFVEWLKGGARV